MYNPAQFKVDDPQVLREFIAAHPLGALVAMTSEGLVANHIPMMWEPRGEGLGCLRGHLARANRLWQLLPADSQVLVIFGGADRYITPSWYPAKREHGKVVPTWNYSVVHAHGAICFLDERGERLQLVEALTDWQEGSRAEPWKVSDAPADYIDVMLKNIVTFEISVTRLEGKFKASQHRPEEERRSVDRALESEGVPSEARAEVVKAPKP
jgi:transcriptional regulator